MANNLYGVKNPSQTKVKEISSSTSLAFSSNLASLISTSSSSSSRGTGAGRPRPSKNKSDIFTSHNKNVKKRSAADLADHGDQKHQTRDDIGSVEADMLHRSKRKMEEKVRLYNAMKRGEYVGREDGFDDRGLVDFDRKWAEKETQDDEGSMGSSSSEDEDNDDGGKVSYIDEFGRTRQGTKSQALREERRRKIQANAAAEQEQMSARPAMPSNIIYGDAVQAEAFNPDEVIFNRMANLAEKRDRSATPPPETHYNATAEVRNRGTGFYTFSHDAEERKREMEALERERLETERIRQDKRTQARIEREEKSKAEADRFLSELEVGDHPVVADKG